MSTTITELNPLGPVLKIRSREILLSLVTLEKEVLFISRYGSLAKMFNALADEGALIFSIIWDLVIDKNRFENDLEVFQKYILKHCESAEELGKNLSSCLNEAVSKAQPVIKNKKRYKAIQEIKNTGIVDAAPCYASYFDSISKRYGYTLKEFYDLTLNQLHILLNVIGDKSYEELEVQAALQGRSLKPRMDFADISEEQEEEQEAQAAEAVKLLQKKYQERLKNGK